MECHSYSSLYSESLNRSNGLLPVEWLLAIQYIHMHAYGTYMKTCIQSLSLHCLVCVCICTRLEVCLKFHSLTIFIRVLTCQLGSTFNLVMQVYNCIMLSNSSFTASETTHSIHLQSAYGGPVWFKISERAIQWSNQH